MEQILRNIVCEITSGLTNRESRLKHLGITSTYQEITREDDTGTAQISWKF